MLTAQEGRLPIETVAWVNPDETGCRNAAAQYLCALAVESGPLPGVKTGENAALLYRR